MAWSIPERGLHLQFPLWKMSGSFEFGPNRGKQEQQVNQGTAAERTEEREERRLVRGKSLKVDGTRQIGGFSGFYRVENMECVGVAGDASV